MLSAAAVMTRERYASRLLVKKETFTEGTLSLLHPLGLASVAEYHDRDEDDDDETEDERAHHGHGGPHVPVTVGGQHGSRPMTLSLRSGPCGRAVGS